MLVSPAFRPPLLFPEGVGALVKMLFLRALPMFVSPTVGATLLLPKQVRAAPAPPAYAQIAAAAPGPTARRALTASQFPYLDSAPPHTAACIGEMI